MSLTSWALVMAHHREPGQRPRRLRLSDHGEFSGLALLLAFGLLAGPNGDYAFDSMRATTHPGPMSPRCVMLVALVGAGSKAGLVPLHVWLPLAHPAAPSHVSALMSGVMTKVAVYGFIRIVFDLLGPPQWWAGDVVLVLGGITAVLGVLHALMERDLKRLLAYSTVENIGIIFIGLGLALAFRANGLRRRRGAGADRGAVSRAQSHDLQEPAVLRRRRGAARHRRARHGNPGRADPPHAAAPPFAFLVGCAAISGAAAAERLRLGVADLPGGAAAARAAAMGLKLMIPVDRRAAGAGRGAGCRLLRAGVRHLLSRPPAQRCGGAGAGNRSVVAGRDAGVRGAVPADRDPARAR